MTFYEVNVYQKSIDTKYIDITTGTYFTSLEKTRKAFDELCEKCNAKENPILSIDELIDRMGPLKR